MSDTVQVRVTAAIVIDGRVVTPGNVVVVPLDIAASLVRRGKVVRAAAAAPEAPREAISEPTEQSPEQPDENAPAARRPGRPRKN